MEFKTPKTPKLSKFPSQTSQRGVTLLELVLVIFVATVMLITFFVFANPAGRKTKARDTKRLADMAVLDRVINEHFRDNRAYPDAADTLRVSTSLPSGGISLENASSGWINENLAVYTPKLPTDPTNDASYYYSYYHTDFSYELNARLESMTEEMENDGGDDAAAYEMGNNLQLMSP